MLSAMNRRTTYLHLLVLFLLGFMDIHAQGENFFDKEKPVLSYYETSTTRLIFINEEFTDEGRVERLLTETS